MVKEQVYRLLVNRIPIIQKNYQKKRENAFGTGILACWAYLLKMNFSYYVFHDKELMKEDHYDYDGKKLYSEGSESALSYRRPPQDLARVLETYDVISFDVFDTLVFRPFSNPEDLFYLLGDQLEYPDFKRIRQEMERNARQKKYAVNGHNEVNLDEIYQMIAGETGLPGKATMKKEIELEKQLCYANPYMYKVIKKLKEDGRSYIVISDMYLNSVLIKELLVKCGYPAPAACYVSCDYGKSKSLGNLYELVMKKEGENRSYIHVGDNPTSDVKQAKKNGMATCYYKNINTIGMLYRTEDMSAITGSIYRGIVNAHIHNGLHKYSRFYEYGYIYGGLFVTGYCNFIHNYLKKNPMDKILFLSRDGDVLKKAYCLIYPEETEFCQYVYWSRLAATKMAAGRYKYDYFRRFLYHKINQNYTICQIVISMELESMLDALCKTTGLSPQDKLTGGNVEKVKSFLSINWTKVLSSYEPQLKAGFQYFEPILRNCQKAVVVDIGWAGSGAIALDYVINHVWSINCSLTGIVAGTNSYYNAEPDFSETFLQSGKIVSYMYSQRENRDLWKFHNPGKGHNLYWESLLDAPSGSFQGFYPDGRGGVECRFKPVNPHGESVQRIQKGILDFVRDYQKVAKKMGMPASISGRDAYAPMIDAEKEINRDFMKIIEEIMDDTNIT